jgi:glycosyltransferase involved in cell wall biosynthesis
MATDNPLVTVYMPTRNRSDLLSRAIDSVQAQTYSNFELIIVDDCSTDDTEAVVRYYQDKDARIKYIKNSENLGACASRNKAIRAAQGEFITGLDDDDYFMLNRLEIFVIAWDSREKDVVLFFSRYGNHLEDGTVKFEKPIFGFKGSLITQKSLLENFYTGNQVFTKTSSMKAINMFDENILMWQDFDCYYRLLALGKGQRVNDFTYILDISHDQDRISNKSIEDVVYTHNYFKNKNNINNLFYAMLLECHTYNYDRRSIRLLPSMLKFIVNPSRYSIKNLMHGFNNTFSSQE